MPEYEQIRATAAQFVVVPGHVIPEIESVVDRHEHYVVVEKHPHEARIARDLDPRKPS